MGALSPYQADLGFVAEHELILVVDVVELLLRDVDSGLGDVVGLALLQHVEELVDLLVEAGGANLSRVVHEGDVEELALASLVRPVLDVCFGQHASFDGPSGSRSALSLAAFSQSPRRRRQTHLF